MNYENENTSENRTVIEEIKNTVVVEEEEDREY